MNKRNGFVFTGFENFRNGLAYSYLIALFTLCADYCLVMAGEVSTSEVYELITKNFSCLIVGLVVLRIVVAVFDIAERYNDIASGVVCTLCFALGCAVAYISFFRYSRQLNICSITFVERYTMSNCTVFVIVLLMAVVGKMLDESVSRRCKKQASKDQHSVMPSDSIERTRIHESGHAVMSFLLGGVSNSIQVKEDCSGFHTFSMEQLSAEDMRKVILIKYAGATAEELTLGTHHAGCGIGPKSDFMQAVDYIKAYLILTDPSCSKTGLDPDMNEKIIKVSTELYKEAKELLSEHVGKIRILADALAETKYLSSERITEILSAEE